METLEVFYILFYIFYNFFLFHILITASALDIGGDHEAKAEIFP